MNEVIMPTQNFNQSDKIRDLDTGSERDTNGWSGFHSLLSKEQMLIYIDDAKSFSCSPSYNGSDLLLFIFPKLRGMFLSKTWHFSHLLPPWESHAHWTSATCSLVIFFVYLVDVLEFYMSYYIHSLMSLSCFLLLSPLCLSVNCRFLETEALAYSSLTSQQPVQYLAYSKHCLCIYRCELNWIWFNDNCIFHYHSS